jgi:hypothetical protein
MGKFLDWLICTLCKAAFLAFEFYVITANLAPHLYHRGYPRGARQAEAKIALAAIYGAERSFYSEYAGYVSSMDAIGYAPEGNRRFYAAGFDDHHRGTIPNYTGTLERPSWEPLNAPFTCKSSRPPLGPALEGLAQTFVAKATGCIRQGQTNWDTWSINEKKLLKNEIIAL